MAGRLQHATCHSACCLTQTSTVPGAQAGLAMQCPALHAWQRPGSKDLWAAAPCVGIGQSSPSSSVVSPVSLYVSTRLLVRSAAAADKKGSEGGLRGVTWNTPGHVPPIGLLSKSMMSDQHVTWGRCSAKACPAAGRGTQRPMLDAGARWWAAATWLVHQEPLRATTCLSRHERRGDPPC